MSNMITEAMSGMDFSGAFTTIFFWLGWGLLGLLILGVFVLFYYFMSFSMKVDTWTLHGSGKDGVFSFGKKKKNRVKWINKKTAWRPLFPLFNKMELEPFDSEYIYPGKQMMAFILNDKWVPGRFNITVTEGKNFTKKEKADIEEEVLQYLKDKHVKNEKKFIPGVINIDKNEQEIRCEINPVPYYVRNWQSLQHKKNAKEFAEHNFWEDNKYFFMVIVTSAICLVMVGITVYFTYKFATGGSAGMANLADALRSWNTIGSI